jgi:transposase
MKVYSMDLRDRVVAACDSGEWTRAEVAEQFGVSPAWVYRLLQRRRMDGTYAPRGHRGGHPPAFSGQRLRQLDEAVEKQPDATLAELREQCGIHCSLVAIHNTLRRLGYRRKKRRFGPLSKIGRM